MSEAAFQAQIPKTLAFEGGYVNDPSDPGGETNFGISARAYPDLDIRGLTVAQATDIYHSDYWLAPHIDRLPDTVSGKVFDMGVNMGARTAIRLWQQTINDVAAPNPLLVEDGRIGPLTVAASSLIGPNTALTAYKQTLSDHYMAIIRANPSMAKYQRGWLRRANA